MKSRRVLQIFVAVLSIILLVCLAAVAAVLYLANYLSFLPQQLVEFGDTFRTGLKTVSDKLEFYDWSTPVIFFGVPGFTLLLAVILILTKSKNGKNAKNVAGCIFALIGVAALTACSFVYAKDLYATNALLIAYCVNGGVLALFVLFIGLALGVKPKKVVATEAVETQQMLDDTEPHEEETEITANQEVETTDDRDGLHESEPEQEVEEEVTEYATEKVEEVESDVDGNREQEMADEIERLQEELKRLQSEKEKQQLVYEDEPITPATQYVPHPDVTIHDIVQKTYGKQSGELNATTLAKINKVRALYEAKAISEQEYIKLINKYLGF